MLGKYDTIRRRARHVWPYAERRWNAHLRCSWRMMVRTYTSATFGGSERRSITAGPSSFACARDGTACERETDGHTTACNASSTASRLHY